MCVEGGGGGGPFSFFFLSRNFFNIFHLEIDFFCITLVEQVRDET